MSSKTYKQSISPKIFLSQVGERQVRFAWSEADAWLEALLEKELHDYRAPKSSAQWSGEVNRLGHHLTLHGQYRLELQPLCSRCGKSFSTTIAKDFEMLLVPQAKEATQSSARHGKAKGEHLSFSPETTDDEAEEWGASEEAFVEDDIGASYVAHDEVDLSYFFMEQILLELPMNFLCREDCPGLCPQCGADWSLSKCQCSEEKVDPRWDVLKKIKLS